MCTMYRKIICFEYLQMRSCYRLASDSSTTRLTENEDSRDISRLTQKQYDIIHGKFTPSMHLEKYKRYRNKMYAIHGASSGYDPATMWPTINELQKLNKYEEQWEPQLDSLLSDLKNRQEQSHNELEERRLEVEKCMAKMPELLRQFEAKQEKKLDEELKKEEKWQVLLEEARDFFGYEVDPRDAKFQEMVEKKELAEKQAEKQRRKELKLAKMMAKYQSAVSKKPTTAGGGGAEENVDTIHQTDGPDRDP